VGPRPLDELADGEIRVLDRAFAPAGRGDVDAAVRIGIGTVIGRGHDVHEETLFADLDFVEQGQGVVEQHLVGHAPDVLEDHRLFREIRAVDGDVVIAGEIGVHVVEVAVTAVYKRSRETHVLEHLPDGGACPGTGGVPSDSASSPRTVRVPVASTRSNCRPWRAMSSSRGVRPWVEP
jgi:hypothetical protein